MANRVGISDLDGHKYPNLALMKLSAYHKSLGDVVEFTNPIMGKYDIVYESKVFTFGQQQAYPVNTTHTAKGGTGFNMNNKLPYEIEHTCPDYSLYGSAHAYGFLTRGCIRKCQWCVVPSKEGPLVKHADISEFISDKKSAVLMDNNPLASDWGLSQIVKIIGMKIKIDFNQGLDARIIADNPQIAELLSRVKWLSPIRMACDTLSQLDSIIKSVELLRKYGATPKNYFVYVLGKHFDDTMLRSTEINALGCDPFVQPYRDPSGEVNVSDKLRKLARWVNHKAIFRSVKWEDYK